MEVHPHAPARALRLSRPIPTSSTTGSTPSPRSRAGFAPRSKSWSRSEATHGSVRRQPGDSRRPQGARLSRDSRRRSPRDRRVAGRSKGLHDALQRLERRHRRRPQRGLAGGPRIRAQGDREAPRHGRRLPLSRDHRGRRREVGRNRRATTVSTSPSSNRRRKESGHAGPRGRNALSDRGRTQRPGSRIRTGGAIRRGARGLRGSAAREARLRRSTSTSATHFSGWAASRRRSPRFDARWRSIPITPGRARSSSGSGRAPEMGA